MANRAADIRAAVLAAHAGAAVVVERGERFIRQRLADTPDGRKRYVLDATIGALHYQDERGAWQEIDDDLVDDGADGFTVKTAHTPYLLRAAGDGKRRLYPNQHDLTRYIELGGLPGLGTPQRGPNYLTWDRPNFIITVRATPSGVKFTATLKNSKAPTSLSFDVGLVGLTRDGNLLLADGVPVAQLRKPVAVDANGVEREATVSFGGGQVTIALDTAGLAYPITIDPTVDKTVAAGGDDGCRSGATGFATTGDNYTLGRASTVNYHQFFRWVGVTIEGTVSTAYIELYPYQNPVGTPLWTIYGVDEDNPAAPTTYGEFDADPLTAASVNWDGGLTIGQYNASPELKTIFQELVDAYTISDDAVMVQVKTRVSSGNHSQTIYHYEHSSSYAAKLHIEYSTGGGTQYEQAASGALTSTGGPSLITGAPRAGTLTSSGVAARVTGAYHAGTLASAGERAGQVARALAGALTSAGTADLTKTLIKALIGTLTSASSLLLATAKSLAGSLSSAGYLVQAIGRSLSGMLPSGGVVDATKAFTMAVQGVLTGAGTLVRHVQKSAGGALAVSGGLVRNVVRVLIGVLAATGALGTSMFKAAAGQVYRLIVRN